MTNSSIYNSLLFLPLKERLYYALDFIFKTTSLDLSFRINFDYYILLYAYIYQRLCIPFVYPDYSMCSYLCPYQVEVSLSPYIIHYSRNIYPQIILTIGCAILGAAEPQGPFDIDTNVANPSRRYCYESACWAVGCWADTGEG